MKSINRIIKIINPWRWSFLFSSILLVIGIFVRMLEPKIFQVAIDYVVPIFKNDLSSNLHTDKVIDKVIVFLDKTSSGTFLSMLWMLCVLYLFISIVRAAFVFIAKTINASVTEKAIENFRNQLFGHIQRLPMAYFSEISTGELIQRSTGDIETIRRFIGNQLVEVLRLLAIFVFSSYWLFKGNIWFGFISISAVTFIAISAYIFFRKEQKIWQKHEDEADKLNTITQENISGIRVVKAFAQEDEEKKKFEKQNKKKLIVALNHAKLHTFFWPLSDLLVHAQIVLSVLFGGYLVLIQSISLGELVSFYTYIGMVAWPLRQVGRILSEMGMALVAIDRITVILDAEEEEQDKHLSFQEELKSFEFKDIWFKYPEEENYALEALNLKINAGETAVILGATGSGKSTLVKLLLRFYEPEKGEILINGKSIKEFEKAFIRNKIGLVLQEAFLFTETLRANIAYAQKQADHHEILNAAAWSSLQEVETIFSEGYQTMVGEKGVTLSGGQKQRVSLARTLLQNSDILILDDVTSAVDTRTENDVLNNITDNWKDKTILIISHRLTVVPFADKIIIMEKGKIVAEGNHEEVLKTSNFYKQVYKIQNALENDIE